MPKTAQLIIERIVDEGDRVLLYGERDDYHVITSQQKSAGLRPGDVITYEPYGANFGWLQTQKE